MRKAGISAKASFSMFGVTPALVHPRVKLAQQHPSHGGLHLRHPPVGAERLMQPAEAGGCWRW